MSSVREYVVEDPELGPRRAYLSSTVADMANVTPKTVTTWVSSDTGSAPPAPLRGWAPRSDCNPSGRWLIDADMVDAAWGRTTPVEAQQATELDSERQRLADERAMFELERRVFEESRIQQLEDENARLRAANERLSSQVSKLGSVIRELTSDAIS
jgi:hypothetical protein